MKNIMVINERHGSADVYADYAAAHDAVRQQLVERSTNLEDLTAYEVSEPLRIMVDVGIYHPDELVDEDFEVDPEWDDAEEAIQEMFNKWPDGPLFPDLAPFPGPSRVGKFPQEW